VEVITERIFKKNDIERMFSIMESSGQLNLMFKDDEEYFQKDTFTKNVMNGFISWEAKYNNEISGYLFINNARYKTVEVGIALIKNKHKMIRHGKKFLQYLLLTYQTIVAKVDESHCIHNMIHKLGFIKVGLLPKVYNDGEGIIIYYMTQKEID